MFQKIFSGVLFIFVLAVAPSAYAGKVELTTYYPAPYGEYKNLNSTEDANFATVSGRVGIGTTAPAAGTKLDVNGTVKMTGLQLGTVATAGHVLTATADGTATWQAATGGGGGCYVSYTNTCLTGFTRKGPVGTWGYCTNVDGTAKDWSFFRPPGGGCASIGATIASTLGTACVCCQT